VHNPKSEAEVPEPLGPEKGTQRKRAQNKRKRALNKNEKEKSPGSFWVPFLEKKGPFCTGTPSS
jgi:hypothetical protein